MSDRIIHLKIKIVNLADEARTIRAEERKALRAHRAEYATEMVEKSVRPDRRNAPPGAVFENRKVLVPYLPSDRAFCPAYQSLHGHRKGTVRHVARENLLAYGFLRGMPYSAMEARCDEAPNFESIKKIAARFSDATLTEWEVWLEEAKVHLEAAKKAA